MLAYRAADRAYTMIGGVQAVTWTDVKQMFVVVSAVLAAVFTLIFSLPSNVRRVGDALHIARRHRPDDGDRLQLRPVRTRTRSGRG